MSTAKSELFRASRENLEWFKDNYKTLMKDCNEQWVVIQDKKVVAKGSTYETISEAIREADKKSALVEFIDSKQLAMFF